MDIHFDLTPAQHYKSNAQKARVLTENWLKENGYCPNCGCQPMQKAGNNLPVFDFFCPSCQEQFELKSKQASSVGKSINDGAYHAMIERIQSDNNPNFFFLCYQKTDYTVWQLMVVPKHFITTNMIRPRKALPESAQRAGWIGCTIQLNTLPEHGKILLIDQAKIVAPEKVLQQWQNTLFLRQQNSKARGWLLAIMKCIDHLPEQFHLEDLYRFVPILSKQFPNNQHIKDKIRQQLQILRDKQLIAFLGRGTYKKINTINQTTFPSSN